MEKNIVQAEIDVLRAMGVEIKCGVEVGKDITIAQLREQGYKAFYIAVGCQGGRKTGVAGEDAKGVMTGVELLHITTDDESYKLTGDTVVIGGGNVAIDVSRTAIRCGSPKVSQVSLETRDIMPALPEEIETAESEGINIIGGWGPKEILTEDGKVTGIVFKKCTSVKDADGRFNPQYDENEVGDVKIDQVVIGSCTNGRMDDLRIAAKILEGKKVADGIRVIVIPATQKIYLQAMEEGLLKTFIEAGAIVSTPTCGPCLGGYMGVLAEGERCVSTTNRNFVGRMGHVDSEVYLASPAVAAASAITGKISGPKDVM